MTERTDAVIRRMKAVKMSSTLVDRMAEFRELEKLVPGLLAENAALRRQRDELHATTARYWNVIIGYQGLIQGWRRVAGKALSIADNAVYSHTAERAKYLASDVKDQLTLLIYGTSGSGRGPRLEPRPLENRL